MTYIKLTDTRDINENVNIDSIGTSLDSDNSDLNQNGGGMLSSIKTFLFGEDKNLLLLAFTENNVNAALFLIDKLENCVCDETNESGKTIVHYLSHLSNNKFFCDFLNILLDKGTISSSILNMQDNLGNTPLHYCVLSGNDKLCDRMIELGADPDIKNNGSSIKIKNTSECKKDSVFNKLKQDSTGNNTFIINLLSSKKNNETSIGFDNDDVTENVNENVNENVDIENSNNNNVFELLSKLQSDTSDAKPITITEITENDEDNSDEDNVNKSDVNTDELIKNLLGSLENTDNNDNKNQNGGQIGGLKNNLRELYYSTGFSEFSPNEKSDSSDFELKGIFKIPFSVF